MGTAIHAPSMPNSEGNRSKEPTINTRVLKKESSAEIFPLPKAVNSAERKMLIPIKI